MPSTSDISDLRSERLASREEHYRRSAPAPSESKKRVNSADLFDIGRQFPTKQDSWPKSIELTDDEAIPRKPDLTPKSTKMSLDMMSDQSNGPPDGETSTPAGTRTPTQGGPYLPASEMEELRRQSSAKHKPGNRTGQSSEASSTRMRHPSPCTTVEQGAIDEQAPEPPSRAHTAFSTGHTPSHRSLGTVDEENRSGGEGPRSPLPWSEYFDQKYGRTAGSTKE